MNTKQIESVARSAAIAGYYAGRASGDGGKTLPEAVHALRLLASKAGESVADVCAYHLFHWVLNQAKRLPWLTNADRAEAMEHAYKQKSVSWIGCVADRLRDAGDHDSAWYADSLHTIAVMAIRAEDRMEDERIEDERQRVEAMIERDLTGK